MSEAPNRIEVLTGDNWRNKREIADHFGIGLRTVTDWMHRKILPFVKIGHVVRFNLQDCDIAVKAYQVDSKFKPANI